MSPNRGAFNGSESGWSENGFDMSIDCERPQSVVVEQNSNRILRDSGTEFAAVYQHPGEQRSAVSHIASVAVSKKRSSENR